MILYQWLCPSIKTFTTEFRQRYDFEFRFGFENLKSSLIPQNFLKRPFFKIKFHFECVFLDVANMNFLGVKIIDFQNDSISVALSFNKDLYNQVPSKI